ncbi:hypothetical protein [Spongiactinospora sp. TRM90649]|uniref:hypothetical protein n=1 Tax=Spongiactinospora sp. TRM90649 TaxID=3031114 RepID=UPI0023F769BC|nr:hypothetical protein [Spongiactinospora sp. TRM90649]MDF5755280.1 hypothetical protein [Spongiactinospora sp. TRM90649]
MDELPSPPPAYVDHLRSLSDSRLVALLAEHELARSAPVPVTFGEVAEAIVRRVLRGSAGIEYDRFEHEVRDALLILGDRPIGLAELGRLLGPACRPGALKRTADRFRALGLAWGDDDGLCLLEAHLAPETGQRHERSGLGRPIRGLLARYDREQLAPVLRSLGLTSGGGDPLERVAAVFADAEATRRRVARLADRPRALLEGLAASDRPCCSVYGDEFSVWDRDEPFRRIGLTGARDLVMPLVEQGLLVVTTYSFTGEPIDFAARSLRLELPREIGMALRGDSPYGRLHPCPPDLAPVEVGVARADRAGAASAFAVLGAADRLLARCDLDPPSNLRWRQAPFDREPTEHHGLDEREMERLTAAVDVPGDLAALLLEIAVWADLLALAPDETVWLPTPLYDAWRSAPPARRWFTLARAWLAMERTSDPEPGLAQHDTVLGPNRYASPAERRAPLDVLADLPPGQGTDPTQVNALLEWRHTGGPVHAGFRVRRSLGEAARLGVTGDGALTTYGRALLAGRDGDECLGGLLPAVLRRPTAPRPRSASALSELRDRRDRARRRAAVPRERDRVPLRYSPSELFDAWSPCETELALVVHAMRAADRRPGPPARESRKVAGLREAAASWHDGIRWLEFADRRGRHSEVMARVVLVTGGVVVAVELIDRLTFTIPLSWITGVTMPTEDERRSHHAYRSYPVKYWPDPRRPADPWDDTWDIAEMLHSRQR